MNKVSNSIAILRSEAKKNTNKEQSKQNIHRKKGPKGREKKKKKADPF